MKRAPLTILERLEDRLLFNVTAVVRYTYDTNDFFDTRAKKDLMQKAVDAVVGRLGDSLSAIAPSGDDTWTASFPHPGTGATQSIPNLSVSRNRIILYVGGRELGSTLGLGGAGSYSASGSSDFLRIVRTRGESGVDNDTDFAPWGGAITFDTSTNWHFGETTAGLEDHESDFYSVALHELAHALGFGGADSWDAKISSGQFTGNKSVAAYDGSGNVPLNLGEDHWASGTTDGGAEAAMDPSLMVGTRKTLTELDFAGLDDIGWNILPAVRIEAVDAVAREQGPNRGVFRVTRTGSTESALRVRLRIKGTATNGDDFREIATSVRIPAGSSSANVVIRPTDDNASEGTENVRVYLRERSAYGIDVDADGARVNIADNDASSERRRALVLLSSYSPAGSQNLFSDRSLEPDREADEADELFRGLA